MSGTANVRGRRMQEIGAQIEALIREAKEIGATKVECERLIHEKLGVFDDD